MKELKTLAAVLGAATLACGDSVSPIVGTWIGTITTGPYFGGSGTIAFSPNGTYTGDYNSDRTPEVSGTYTTSGNRVSITDTSGSFACPLSDVGTYDFSVEGAALKFSVVSDPCATRAEILTSTRWGG